MNYIEVSFSCTPSDEVFSDILSAHIAEAGFESFVTTDDGLVAYIQENIYDKSTLDGLLENFPVNNIHINYSTQKIEGKDWNEEWEKNYFKPLVIDNRCIVQSTFHNEPAIYDYNIVIDPKMAFGTGHHQTTELMIRELLDFDLQGKSLLDMGCGTAILAILASMRGANPIVAIDIDQWAYDNAIENIRLNDAEHIDVKIGDADLLLEINKNYDIILANINRNILLQDINSYSRHLNAGGFLFMSGFYSEDVQTIEDECIKNNLNFIRSNTKDNWAVVLFQKQL